MNVQRYTPAQETIDREVIALGREVEARPPPVKRGGDLQSVVLGCNADGRMGESKCELSCASGYFATAKAKRHVQC